MRSGGPLRERRAWAGRCCISPRWRSPSALAAALRERSGACGPRPWITLCRHVFSSHAPAAAAPHGRAARSGARDRAVGRHLVYPLFVTHGSDRREPIESMPGDRAADDLPPRGGGRRDRRARHPGRAAVRDSRRQGRRGVRRLRRRGHRAARGAGAQAGAARPHRDHRRLPVRVHVARPLRRRARRRRGRQRRDARAAREDRDLACRGGRRRGRSVRHDGRPRRARSASSSTPRATATCRSSPTARSSHPPSTGRFARRRSRRPRSATGAATRWTRPTRARRCARRRSTSTRAPTW